MLKSLALIGWLLSATVLAQGGWWMLGEYRWENRLLLVFAPDAQHDAMIEQLTALAAQPGGIKERDLLIWQITYEGDVIKDGDEMPDHEAQAFYFHFKVPRTEFAVILVGKDGGQKLRRSSPVSVEKLFSVIDAMPMRQLEMLENSQGQ